MLTAAILPPDPKWRDLDSAPVPTPASGFSTKAESVHHIILSRASQPVFAARLHRFHRSFLRNTLRCAVIGPLTTLEASSATNPADVEEAYRVIVDKILETSPGAHVIRIVVEESREAEVQLLVQLALELGATARVASDEAAVTVDLYTPGPSEAVVAALTNLEPGPIVAGVRERLARWRQAKTRVVDTSSKWFRLDVSGPRPDVSPPPGLVFSEVSPEEIRRRPGRYGVSLRRAATFSDHHRMFIGTIDGSLAYRMRVTTEPAAVAAQLETAVRDAAGPRALLVTFCHTLPRFRGRAIYPAALSWLASVAPKWGAERLVLSVRADNESSLRGIAKAGFVPLI